MRVVPNAFERLWSDCGADVLEAVSRVGESGWYVLGPEVTLFEKILAEWAKVPYVVGVANGMDALEIALRISGIGPGDKVITTPLSAFPTALSITRAGAQPIFVDTDIHGLLDPDAVEKAIKFHDNIKAIVPVHLYGQLADVAALQHLADRIGALLFEDAAQAIGAKRHEICVADHCRMASISFYPTKNLGVLGDGGALFVHSEDSAEAARSMRNYGQTTKYVHDFEGLNSRLDEIHAAMLTTAFLPRLDGWLAARRRIAKTYLDQIINPEVTLMPGPDPEGSSWHLFPVRIDPTKREAFMSYLSKAGIISSIHYPFLMPEQRALIDRGSIITVGSLNTARAIATSEVSLPIHPYLTESEQNFVISTINAWNG